MAAASSSSGSDREKVQRIYERFNEMFRAEQSKSKALLNQRDYLVELLGLQEEQWTSRLGYMQSRLDQKKIEEAKWKNYYCSKNNILINVKDDQISLHRNNTELTEKDLENYHNCIISLNSENSDLKKKLEASQTLNSKAGTSSQNDPKTELQKQKQAYKTLKTDYETLKKEKNHKIAGLITEKDFSWHQYELTQKNFETLKNSRNLELEKANLANEKLKKLLEETEISSGNKDGMIERLSEEIRKLKRMNEEKDEIILRLKNETASKTVQSRNKRKLGEQESSGMNLRSRNIKRKLDEQESSDTSSDKSSKTDRKNSTKRKFESVKGTDMAITSRSRAKKNIDLSNSGMRACSSNSERSSTKIYLSSIKIPKVNNNISHLQH